MYKSAEHVHAVYAAVAEKLAGMPSLKGGKSEPSSSAPAGEGGRFKALKGKLSKEKGVKDPGALAAAIGRKKFGKSKFQSMSKKGNILAKGIGMASRGGAAMRAAGTKMMGNQTSVAGQTLGKGLARVGKAVQKNPGAAAAGAGMVGAGAVGMGAGMMGSKRR